MRLLVFRKHLTYHIGWKEKNMERFIIDQVKEAVVKEASGMRALNKELPTSGKRMDIHVGDREINIIHFSAKSQKAPVIIGFHGGGFLFGGNAMNEKLWTAIRDYLDINVISVEYRKSPDYQWREALEDAYDATLYLYEHSDEFGFDKNQIYVMGGSAGAGLAASLCIYAKMKGFHAIKKQILIYPFLDCDTDPMSKGEGSLTGPIMYVFNELHCKPEETKMSLVSPIFASLEELEGLPQAIMYMADNDNLKHEGFKYAQMLKDAGVDVVFGQAKGMPHGYIETGFGENFPGEFHFLDESVVAQIESGETYKASMETLEFIKENLNNK